MTNPSVQTSYANGSGNTVRLQSRTYPDGRVVSVDYGTAGEANDRIGRIAALVDDDDTPLAEYQYLGLGAVVQQDSPEADLRYTLVNPSGGNDPDTGDIYSGLDRFGRVKDVRWRDVSAVSNCGDNGAGVSRCDVPTQFFERFAAPQTLVIRLYSLFPKLVALMPRHFRGFQELSKIRARPANSS